jgi:hypothetical protein
MFLWPWLAFLKNQISRARVRSNHFVFGMNDSGNINLDLMLQFLKNLPPGVTEIYFHPTTRRCPELDQIMRGYSSVEEFEALTSPLLPQALLAADIQRVGFSDL